MVDIIYIRDRHIFRDPVGNIKQEFDSINKAKKASRDIQLANGGLGCGSMRIRVAL